MIRNFLPRICSYFGRSFSEAYTPVKFSSCVYKTASSQRLTTTRNIFTDGFKLNSVLTQRLDLRLLAPQTPEKTSVRPVTKFSLHKGKRKTVKAVLKRFYRLDWGMWIRGKCGRQKKLFKKSKNRKRRLRQHVFTNATQSYLLDKMVTKYWRKPKYYIDDPYEPYHRREEFLLTRKKPLIPKTE